MPETYLDPCESKERKAEPSPAPAGGLGFFARGDQPETLTQMMFLGEA